jgi:polysaccharide pyruvyl transferase WcaK-like protein
MWEISTIGATLSGNKGAASMLHSALENLPQELGDVRFRILSVYPVADKKLNQDDHVEIVPARPAALVIAVPLAFIWAFLQALHLPPGLLRRNRVLSTLDQSDALIDLSGISFNDKRTVELFYNVACVLPAILLGKPVIKVSQAMGPFHTPLNRAMAKLLLPRMALTIARGERTLAYLEELGIKKVILCADAAFSMEEEDPEAAGVLDALDRFDRPIVGISASSVVETYCQRHDIDYSHIMACFADRAIEAGYGVWLIAHSVRLSEKGGRTNDVDTCRAIYDRMEHQQTCETVIEDHSPATLRAIIGACDLFVASRFHAMVSALAEGVPVLVTGWSHKYAEVLEMFDLETWVLGHEQLSVAGIWDAFQRLSANEGQIREKIARHLPNVVASSRRNMEHAAQVIKSQGEIWTG